MRSISCGMYKEKVRGILRMHGFIHLNLVLYVRSFPALCSMQGFVHELFLTYKHQIIILPDPKDRQHHC